MSENERYALAVLTELYDTVRRTMDDAQLRDGRYRVTPEQVDILAEAVRDAETALAAA